MFNTQTKFRTNHNAKLTYLALFGVIFVLASITVLGSMGIINPAKIKRVLTDRQTSQELGAGSGNNQPSSRTAYEIAIKRAKEWQGDAVLAFIGSGLVDSAGKVKDWNLTFVSENNKDQKGFLVELKDYQVVSTKEINYSGNGADLPGNTLTQEEAIARVKQMAGYENEPVLGVEAVYGAGNKVWYWGVKTGKGTVSVEAKK